MSSPRARPWALKRRLAAWAIHSRRQAPEEPVGILHEAGEDKGLHHTFRRSVVVKRKRSPRFDFLSFPQDPDQLLDSFGARKGSQDPLVEIGGGVIAAGEHQHCRHAGDLTQPYRDAPVISSPWRRWPLLPVRQRPWRSRYRLVARPHRVGRARFAVIIFSGVVVAAQPIHFRQAEQPFIVLSVFLQQRTVKRIRFRQLVGRFGPSHIINHAEFGFPVNRPGGDREIRDRAVVDGLDGLAIKALAAKAPPPAVGVGQELISTWIPGRQGHSLFECQA